MIAEPSIGKDEGKMSPRLGLMMALAFLLGARNARDLMDLMPLAGAVSQAQMLMVVVIVGAFSLFLFRAFLWGAPVSTGFKYFMPLIVVVFLKYLFLFLLSPAGFVSEMGMGSSAAYLESNFTEACLFAVIFLPAVIFVLCIRDGYELSMVNLFLVIGCAVAPVVSFILYPEMIGSRANRMGGVSFNGGFWNSSVIGIVVTLWSSVALWRYYSKKVRGLLIALIGIIGLGSVVGLSRTAFVCLGASCAVYMVLSKGFVKRICVLLLVFAGLFALYKSFGSVVEGLERRISSQSSLKDDPRMRIWSDYTAHIGEFWAIGVVTKPFKTFSAVDSGPHSVYLNWLVHFGVLGLASFLWLLFGLVRATFSLGRLYSRERMALAAAWLTSYLALASYNQSGFIEPGVYAVMAFMFVQVRLAGAVARE